jgi:hypothetical protein
LVLVFRCSAAMTALGVWGRGFSRRFQSGSTVSLVVWAVDGEAVCSLSTLVSFFFLDEKKICFRFANLSLCYQADLGSDGSHVATISEHLGSQPPYIISIHHWTQE